MECQGYRSPAFHKKRPTIRSTIGGGIMPAHDTLCCRQNLHQNCQNHITKRPGTEAHFANPPPPPSERARATPPPPPQSKFRPAKSTLGVTMMLHATKRGFKDCPGFLNSTGRLGPKRGRKCYITPAFSGVPNKRGQNQNSKPPLRVTMMPLGAPSISKYGSLVRPSVPISALVGPCWCTKNFFFKPVACHGSHLALERARSKGPKRWVCVCGGVGG